MTGREHPVRDLRQFIRRCEVETFENSRPGVTANLMLLESQRQ